TRGVRSDLPRRRRHPPRRRAAGTPADRRSPRDAASAGRRRRKHHGRRDGQALQCRRHGNAAGRARRPRGAGIGLGRTRLRRHRGAGGRQRQGGGRMNTATFLSNLFGPLHEWLLSLGAFGLVVWIVLKILVIAVPVILAVAFYVVWERKLIGWMHVRHGPMYVGLGVFQAFADVFELL